MKKLLVISSLFVVLFAQNAYAVDSSPSADVKTKLEELKKEIASKAAKLKSQVDYKLRNKAYIGELKAKSDTTLTLATASDPRIVNVNQDTVYEGKIKLENYVAALGDSDETGVLTAKKVILLPTAKSQKPKAYLWGQIIAISDELTTLKNNEFKNVAVLLPLRPEVKLNDFVILTGSKDKNNIFDAGFVYVIPQKGFIKPKKEVYPERSRGATPSAS